MENSFRDTLSRRLLRLRRLDRDGRVGRRITMEGSPSQDLSRIESSEPDSVESGIMSLESVGDPRVRCLGLSPVDSCLEIISQEAMLSVDRMDSLLSIMGLTALEQSGTEPDMIIFLHNKAIKAIRLTL